MLVIMRFRYGTDQPDRATADLALCRDEFARCPGFVSGLVGRAVDDAESWVLSMTWEHVGAYRRALSSDEIKALVVPLLSRALDEPSAYEIIAGEGSGVPNEARPRGGG